jgi:serine/threonine-protein kinase RsbW
MRQEKKTLRLKSVPESIHEVERLIEDVCDSNNLNQSYLGCITVTLTEAFSNALDHGNKRNPEKVITVTYEKTSTGLSFRIKDEGDGFNFHEIPEIKEDGHEKIFPGRGIFLIKTLSDNVMFVGPGNEIEIGFKISSIDFETTVDRIRKLKDYSVSTSRSIK